MAFYSFEIQGFVPSVVHEFDANISKNINVLKSLEFEKVYVRGRV